MDVDSGIETMEVDETEIRFPPSIKLTAIKLKYC
jgi:hypothetical protein